MLAINLADDSNIIMHGLPGVGKTTAMAIAMVAHCNENVHEIQVLCFVSTYESAMLIASLCKYTKITCNTVTSADKWKEIKSTILIGTPIELSKLAGEQMLSERVNFICFDDADLSMPFESVSSNVLRRSSAKVLCVTSSMNKTLLELSNQNGTAVVFKSETKDLLNISVKHLMVNSKEDERFEVLLKILLVMRPQDRVVVFSNVSDSMIKIFEF